MATTIQIEEELKRRLEELKIHPREPFNLVIKRLIESKIDEEPLSKETLKSIERAIGDIKAGRVYPTSQLKRKLRIR